MQTCTGYLFFIYTQNLNEQRPCSFDCTYQATRPMNLHLEVDRTLRLTALSAITKRASGPVVLFLCMWNELYNKDRTRQASLTIEFFENKNSPATVDFMGKPTSHGAGD